MDGRACQPVTSRCGWNARCLAVLAGMSHLKPSGQWSAGSRQCLRGRGSSVYLGTGEGDEGDLRDAPSCGGGVCRLSALRVDGECDGDGFRDALCDGGACLLSALPVDGACLWPASRGARPRSGLRAEGVRRLPAPSEDGGCLRSASRAADVRTRSRSCAPEVSRRDVTAYDEERLEWAPSWETGTRSLVFARGG